MKIRLESNIVKDNYTDYIRDAFDIQTETKTTTDIEFNLSEAKNFNWNIGVIYGNSGSGKTSILKKMGKINKVEFNNGKSVISNFDWLTPEDASDLLSSMGLSSVPSWLRPFHLLSNGEQYRAELAYKVGKAKDNEVILIDEFTSVVDRDVAKAMSFALQKYIRKTNKKIILASCHYDIMEWIMPDWTCSPQKGGALERGEWLRQGRPQIELQVSRVEHQAWNIFKKHHYLTDKVHKACKFFLYEWNGVPVGFVAGVSQPGAGTRKNSMAISRIVVLPDFQGLGLGVSILKHAMAMLSSDNNRRVYIRTIHPKLGKYFKSKKDLFKPTSTNGKALAKDPIGKRRQRKAFSYEYIGEKELGFENIILSIKDMRDLKKEM